jgi:hypothetical protein
MGSEDLDRLVTIGELKTAPFSQPEFDGLISSGVARLDDSKNESLNVESRFDLAYNASHALSLAALRWHGYRSNNRYLVFQCLPHTLDLPNELWRVLDQAHRKRNLAEYEGCLDVNKKLVDALIRVAMEVANRINKLPVSREG